MSHVTDGTANSLECSFLWHKGEGKGKPGYARAAKIGDGSAALLSFHREALRVH